MSWEYIRLGNVISTLKGFAFKSTHYVDHGYPIVRVSNFTRDSISDDDLRFYSYEEAENYKKYALYHNDILIQTVGSWEYNPNSVVGKVVRVPEKLQSALLNQNIVKIIPNNNVDNRYLYYRLKCSDFAKYNIGNAVGAANQASITLDTIKDFTFNIPNLNVQKRISDILSTYDEFIDNNQKQIELLEEAAQRLYKEWFVDLRFPGYETTPVVDGIPQGWGYLPLGELIEYEIGGGWGEEQPTEKCDRPAYVIRGTDLYDVTHGNAKSIPYRFHAQSNLNSRRLQDGDIVFEVSGGSKNEGVARTALVTKSLLDFLGEEVICASFCKLIRFKNKSDAKYMYDTFQYLRSSGETTKYDKRSASSIVNYRWKDFLEQQFILVPTTDVLTQYNALAEKMQKTIVNKAQIIEQAKQARDRLLPKLMSGEIEV